MPSKRARKTTTEPRSNARGRRGLLFGAAAALLVGACERRIAKSGLDEPPPGGLAARPERGAWPVAYQRARQEVQQAYAYAATYYDVLRFIPCYCGCVSDGHRSNYDCYVREKRADGWVVLDTHGFG